MVIKRIDARKTRHGYLLTVFVKDGDLFHDLHIGIKHFFKKIQQQEKEKKDESLCQNQKKLVDT